MAREEQLAVSVIRVCYPPATQENANWFIIDTDQGICKGNMSWRPKESERLLLTGSYGSYQGKREFKFTVAALNVPTDSRGLLHYVCEIASGVGASLESQIWDLKGEEWATIQEGDLPRFRGRVFDCFIESLEQIEGDREKGTIISELLSKGCTMNMASAAYERWENETLGVVSSDPYRLAELANYGFSHVDGVIRCNYGIQDSDMRRIRAAIIYVLRQITESGSTLVDWNYLHTECLVKLGGFNDLILQAVTDMFEEGTLKGFKGSRSVALSNDYNAESKIWAYIQEDMEW